MDWKNIDIEIPGELFTSNDAEINFELLSNKTIIGLCGYGRCGKDTLGREMVNKLGFKRISFADTLKEKMNEHMKQQVFEYLINKEVDIQFDDVDFLNPKTIEIKELLRIFMVFFGETLKQKNGLHHWTNQAIEKIGDANKVVITDVRRYNELDLFKYNREQFSKKIQHMEMAEMYEESLFMKHSETKCDFNSLLFHVNQLGLEDSDQLTKDTILLAYQNFLFDDVVNIDSRIPDKNNYREKYIYRHLKDLTIKFPDYFI
jgi:hypothetical protein